MEKCPKYDTRRGARFILHRMAGERLRGDGAHGSLRFSVRFRRPAVQRRLHAIDARRLQESRSWVVCFSILRPFGPSRCSAQVPGSVPFLSGIEGFPQYAGNVMVPFSNDFTLTSMA